jgi:hypothetical protein
MKNVLLCYAVVSVRHHHHHHPPQGLDLSIRSVPLLNRLILPA